VYTYLRLCHTAVAVVSLLTCVSATTVAFASEQESFPVRGLVRPLNQAAIGAGIQARIKEVHFREGDSFRKGDLLVAFDCERQEAELAAADAQHREMLLALNSTSYLHQKGAIGRYDLQVSQVRTEKAAAEVSALKARIKQCNIHAP
jgi:membrane fusion protein (multidrug efflux system)